MGSVEKGRRGEGGADGKKIGVKGEKRRNIKNTHSIHYLKL